MTKRFIGRGNKAPYSTSVIRCPRPIKKDVELLIAAYRQSVIDGADVESDGYFFDFVKSFVATSKQYSLRPPKRVITLNQNPPDPLPVNFPLARGSEGQGA